MMRYSTTFFLTAIFMTSCKSDVSKDMSATGLEQSRMVDEINGYYSKYSSLPLNIGELVEYSEYDCFVDSFTDEKTYSVTKLLGSGGVPYEITGKMMEYVLIDDNEYLLRSDGLDYDMDYKDENDYIRYDVSNGVLSNGDIITHMRIKEGRSWTILHWR